MAQLTPDSPHLTSQLVNLTFDNALLYNGKNKTSLVCVEASRLKKHFNDKYEKKKEGV